MTFSLLDGLGRRKYLTPTERRAFINAALDANSGTSSFCLTLALTGARISEVLALTTDRIDVGNSALVFETLKRRRRGIFRAVPVPHELISRLELSISPTRKEESYGRLWNFSRTTAWKRVKLVMRTANIPSTIAKPKDLRRALAVEAVQQQIAFSVVKRWLGDAKLETTAIYADPIGDEERELAQLIWPQLTRNASTSNGH